MIARLLAALFLIYAFGFVWFAAALPQPSGDVETDAVIVPTGGAGRIPHGIEVLDEGLARHLFVSGVDPEVKDAEFAAEFGVSSRRMACCVTLGFAAVDTRSNAAEIAQWVEDREVKSLRLVTTDWHMRRAYSELNRVLPGNVSVVRDAVPSQPRFTSLLLEYHKLLASWIAGLLDW